MTVTKNDVLNPNGLPMPSKDAEVMKNGVQPPSRLTVNLASSLKALPNPDDLVFGQIMTDHMLIMSHSPETGWSAPEIKPYAPLSLDPASSCFQYCPNVFEGMKAYIGPDGKPRLFRPKLNMARMEKSTDRVALPPFDSDALLVLIKKLVSIDARWIPRAKGCSLYIRPTIIGTRPALGVAASMPSRESESALSGSVCSDVFRISLNIDPIAMSALFPSHCMQRMSSRFPDYLSALLDTEISVRRPVASKCI
ncbi:hypothetical protein EWM64_g7963 [Hericium alpestre]|uniref:Branched-chain-amino-acid aminotransferase n=1 Tax=Hericium alpestre TaxID=135208 RepID=A0A4Y9ZP66_9AGAM|nr:hypothetical protein EWM64_g7963 [Hericium alpestre]